MSNSRHHRYRSRTDDQVETADVEEGRLMPRQQARQRATDDFGHFFRSWIQNPRGIGAVAPSGRLLAKLMATSVRPGSRVIELGGGTGTVTQAILDAGVEPKDLVVVEQNAQFVELLKRRFPSSVVMQTDATAIADRLDGARGSFDFVISGLPLLLFSPARREQLLSHAFELLGPQGLLHQFTYGGRCPIGRDLRARLGLRTSLIGIAPFNLPPAFVYRFARG